MLKYMTKSFLVHLQTVLTFQALSIEDEGKLLIYKTRQLTV